MSRLKGADLGVSLPTGTMNFRGAYSGIAGYAANDVVTDAGLLWLAINAAPVGVTAPSTGPLYVPPASVIASVNAALAPGSTLGYNYAYEPFTVGASALANVSSITLRFGPDASPHVGPVQVGIATAIGANPGAVTWLSGPSVAQTVTPPTSGVVSVTFALPATVTLAATTTYYVVVLGTSFDLQSVNAGAVIVGGISSVGTLGGSSATGTAWTTVGGWTLNFALNSSSLPYWQPLGALQETVNTVSSGSAVTLPDVTVATMHRITLNSGAPIITLPPPGAGKSFTVELVQDATGGRAPTWATPSGAIRWPGGTAPTISTAANAIDVITFACIGGTNWYGFVAGQAFA